METLKRGMKRKTITKILYYKVNKWLQSINDIDVRELAAKNTIVTGGSIASMLLGEPVNDYDIYFKNKETALAVTNYYIHKADKDFTSIASIKEDEDGRIRIHIPSDGIEGTQDNEYTDDEMQLLRDMVEQDNDGEKEKPKYRVTFLSENAITLSDQFQLIIRFYGEPEEIHNNYDFIHAMNYYDFGNNELVLKPEALEAILSKTLVYKGSLYPICSVLRTRKFINRGGLLLF